MEGLGHTRERLSSILVIGAVLFGSVFALVSIADPALANHWCPSLGGGYSPAVFYQGVGTTFTITIVNNIADPLGVTNVLVDFNWDGDTSANGWDSDFGSGSVPPGSSAEFSQTVTPPSATPGMYRVEVQVRGQAAGDSSLGACNFVPGNVELRSIPPLSATASANPMSGNIPLAVAFTATASGGSSPYTYSWTFGDGGTSTSSNPGHTYGRPGTYIARLDVRDSIGSTASDSVTIVADVPPLTATAQANPTSGDAPLAVSFSAAVSGGLAPYSYQWTFGDGSSGASPVVSHTYSAPQTYVAQVTVRDSLGSSVSSSVSVVVRPSPPRVTMTASAQRGVAPLTIAFSALVTGGVSPESVLWDFGDGFTSTEGSPTHQYDRAGMYEVRVTATDALGRTGTDTQTIEVLGQTGLSIDSPLFWGTVSAIGAVAAIAAILLVRKKRKRRRVYRSFRPGR